MHKNPQPRDKEERVWNGGTNMRKKNLRVVHKQVYDRVPVQQVRPRASTLFIPETRRTPIDLFACSLRQADSRSPLGENWVRTLKNLERSDNGILVAPGRGTEPIDSTNKM